MGKLERYSASLMLLNGAIGLAVALGSAALQRMPAALLDAPPYASLLGVVSGLLALRGKLAGLLGGLLFYALQIPSYYSPRWHFNVRSGISVATVVELAHGVLVINVAALAGLLVTVWLLAARRAAARAR